MGEDLFEMPDQNRVYLLRESYVVLIFFMANFKKALNLILFQSFSNKKLIFFCNRYEFSTTFYEEQNKCSNQTTI